MKQGVMIKYAGLYVIVEEIEYAALPTLCCFLDASIALRQI